MKRSRRRTQPVAATRERPAKSGTIEAPGQRLRRLALVEGLMLVLLAVAVYLGLALSSYSPLDPGWSGTGSGGLIQNSVGRSGAWFSDVLYLLFGQLAWLFPLILVWGAVNLFRERRSAHVLSWDLFGLRAAGFVLMLLSSTSLATMHFASSLQASAGGLLGQTMTDITMPALKLAGSTLVFLTLLFVGLTLGLGISWLRLIDATGLRCLQAWDLLMLKLAKWRERQREDREARTLI